MKRTTFLIIKIIASIVCLATIAGYFGNVSWLFDLLVHFRLQYAVILIIALCFFLFFRKRSLAALTFVFFIPNAYEAGHLYFGGNKNTDLRRYLKICSLNLLSRNENTQAVADFIQAKNPDVIILQEFTERWENELAPVIKDYPYRKAVTRTDNFGIAILSKVAMQSVTELDLSPAAKPSLLATVTLDHKPLQILAMHPLPPVGATAFTYRNEQFASVIAMKPVLHENFMIIGDLNITSYSLHFKKMLNALHLVDSRKGFGIQPTWPVWFFLLKIPIDHCLVSSAVFVKKHETGEPVGSDHLPVYLETGFE